MLRQLLPGGDIELRHGDLAFVIRRIRPSALLVEISGYDDGALGLLPLDEVLAELQRFGPLTLFVDATSATGVATQVRELWTAWFQRHQRELKGVHVLVASPYVMQTIEVSKLLSHTGELIRVYADPAKFSALLG